MPCKAYNFIEYWSYFETYDMIRTELTEELVQFGNITRAHVRAQYDTLLLEGEKCEKDYLSFIIVFIIVPHRYTYNGGKRYHARRHSGYPR